MTLYESTCTARVDSFDQPLVGVRLETWEEDGAFVSRLTIEESYFQHLRRLRNRFGWMCLGTLVGAMLILEFGDVALSPTMRWWIAIIVSLFAGLFGLMAIVAASQRMEWASYDGRWVRIEGDEVEISLPNRWHRTFPASQCRIRPGTWGMDDSCGTWVCRDPVMLLDLPESRMPRWVNRVAVFGKGLPRSFPEAEWKTGPLSGVHVCRSEHPEAQGWQISLPVVLATLVAVAVSLGLMALAEAQRINPPVNRLGDDLGELYFKAFFLLVAWSVFFGVVACQGDWAERITSNNAGAWEWRSRVWITTTLMALLPFSLVAYPLRDHPALLGVVAGMVVLVVVATKWIHWRAENVLCCYCGERVEPQESLPVEKG